MGGSSATITECLPAEMTRGPRALPQLRNPRHQPMGRGLAQVSKLGVEPLPHLEKHRPRPREDRAAVAADPHPGFEQSRLRPPEPLAQVPHHPAAGQQVVGPTRETASRRSARSS